MILHEMLLSLARNFFCKALHKTWNTDAMTTQIFFYEKACVCKAAGIFDLEYEEHTKPCFYGFSEIV